MIKRRLLLLIIVFIFLFSLISCNDSDTILIVSEPVVETVIVTETVTVYKPSYEVIYPDDYWELKKNASLVSEKIEELNEKMNDAWYNHYWMYQVHQYLKNAGFNEHVIAGIIGNMYKECGAYEDLRPFVGGSADGVEYYGLCMWSGKYNDLEMLQGKYNGDSFTAQMEYLVSTLPKAFGTKYNEFFNLDSAAEAAEMFAKYYEKPYNTDYTQRALEALNVYEYFN